MLLITRAEEEGYVYLDKNKGWLIKDDAPDWAKEEFREFMEQLDPEPDENGMVKLY